MRWLKRALSGAWMTWLELIRLKRVKYKVIMRWIKGCMVSEDRKESCV